MVVIPKDKNQRDDMVPTFSDKIARLYSAVGKAGAYLWSEAERGAKVEVTVKADHTLVLNLDLESNRIIRESLGDILPLVSEEDGESHSLIDSASEYFVIDPLDGTTTCKRFLSSVGGSSRVWSAGWICAWGNVTGCYFF